MAKRLNSLNVSDTIEIDGDPQTVVMANNPLPDYMDAVLGRPIKPGGGTAGLKWTVSPTRPQKAKAGELWVAADPSQVHIEKVQHIQTNKKEVGNPAPNTIYVLIPESGYPLVETPAAVDFFNSKKYALNVKCPYVLVTGDRGEALDIVRGVYTGAQWKTWGERPDIPTQWQFLKAISASSTWTPPEPGQWYRVHVFGKCGDGGSYTKTISGGTGAQNGYAGGNTGGYACSLILLDDIVPCTVNNSVTSFGTYLSATSGGNAGINDDHNPSSVIGNGIGGTEHNVNGSKGALGSNGSSYSEESNYSKTGGSGGKGNRLKNLLSLPYINNTTNFSVGTGSYAWYDGGHEYSSSAGKNAASYPSLNLNAPVLYGGGQGGGGLGIYSGNWSAPGKGSAGSPGLIIIEKGSTGGSTGPGQGGGDA